jgi:ABC-type ATPase involved in cell division
MPAGLLQMVGETGWQLSHGERSRLYIARALLQRAELIILDESFAALDPENLSGADLRSRSRLNAAGDCPPLKGSVPAVIIQMPPSPSRSRIQT